LHVQERSSQTKRLQHNRFSEADCKIKSLSGYMSYRKFKADHLFTGIKMLGNDKVLITNTKGEIVSIVDEEDAGDNVEILTGIITPGFVNTHCHLELSHMKDLIPEKTGLVDFVYKVINERSFAEEEIYEAINRAENEMLENGIVAVGDICNNNLTMRKKMQHNLAWYNFIEATGWSPGIAQGRWQRTKNLYDEFLKESQLTSVVPHAPYSVSDELWDYLMPFFESKTISIHNQEASFEDELFLQGSGDLLRMYKILNIDNSFFSPSRKSSLQTYFYKLAKAASVIFVHNTFTSQGDIDFIKGNRSPNQQLSFCLCPNANLHIENTLPPVEMLVKNNCHITLGTDSLASNWSLSILDEMKTLQQHFTFLSLEQLLGWATFNGAKALQMDKAYGSFEKGKKPGVVLIENVDNGKLKKESVSKRIL
jgi:cytosine/adenosine deaminase-related metal-dependent hydrolase